MTRHLAFTGFLVVMITVGSLSRPSGAVPNPPAQGAGQQPQSESNMQDMMRMHERMMAEMKAGNATLDALVKQMNAATGDPKVTAVAAVVTELVRQHKAMHEHMGQMHQQMMGGRGMMMTK